MFLQLLVWGTCAAALPPNTGMSLVADVAGSTLANDAYWAAQCQTIPFNTLFIVVDMGAVREYRYDIESTAAS